MNLPDVDELQQQRGKRLSHRARAGQTSLLTLWESDKQGFVDLISYAALEARRACGDFDRFAHAVGESGTVSFDEVLKESGLTEADLEGAEGGKAGCLTHAPSPRSCRRP